MAAHKVVNVVDNLRKANLALLIKQWGGATNLGKKLKHSGPSYLSQLIGAGRPITEKTARRIEDQLDLPTGWMDADHTAEKNTVVNPLLIASVVMAVGAALEDAEMQVAPRKFADLVALVYEEAVVKGTVEEGFVNRIVRLMK